MTRVLMRAGKSPFDTVAAGEVFRKDLIGRNSGNILFADAMHKMLSAPGVEVSVVGPDIPSVQEADRINGEFDALVLPFANAFRPSFRKALLKWASLIKRLRIPCVVTGIGAQAPIDADVDTNPQLVPAVKKFMAAVLDKSASVGVRGEFTRAYLNNLGFRAVETVGCPSMFTFGPVLPEYVKASSLPPDASVAFNLTRNMPANVSRFFHDEIKKRPAMKYVPQGLSDLETMLWGTTAKADVAESALPVSSLSPFFADDRSRFFYDSRSWMEFMREQDYVFGTRMHGTIMALLAGTPATLIAHDSRTLELAEYFEIPHVQAPRVGPGTTVEGLFGEADLTRMRAGHLDRFNRFAAFVRSNGIDIIYDHVGAEDEYEQRLRSFCRPPAVRSLPHTEPQEILSRVPDMVAYFSRRIDALQGNNDALQEQNAALQEQNEALRAEITALSVAIRRLSKKIIRSEKSRAASRN